MGKTQIKMQTKQQTYTFGNLTITQTIWESKTAISKHLDVSRFNGEYYEILNPEDPDHQRAVILMHNYKNGN